MSIIPTATGKHFDLLKPSPLDVCKIDLAKALAKQCRFNGHCEPFYSVAQHSVLSAFLVPIEDRLHALLHDAAEAYIGDIVTPLKDMLPEIKTIEANIHKVICESFGISPEIPESVEHADKVLLVTEKRDLLPASTEKWPIEEHIEPAGQEIRAWPPEVAEKIFLQTLDSLISFEHGGE